MKREEEILNTAREYNNGITLSSPSNVIHFVAGAKWADEHPKNVWHDASEEPEGNNWRILFQDEEGDCWVEHRGDMVYSYNTWDEYIDNEMVVKWAYVSDLLPKGGAE